MRISVSKFATAAFVAASVFTVSSAAFAGATITDRQSWPNEIHASSVRANGSVFDAQASANYSAPVISANPVMYRGGPKSGTR